MVTVRTVMYVLLRFGSKEAFTKWIFIEPSYFYTLFATEISIVVTLLAFLHFSTDSKHIEFPDSESEAEQELEMKQR